MLIETTIYVHKRILEILNKRAEITGKSRTFIIKLLMQRVMSDNQKMIKSYSRIKYQARDAKENWHRLHVGMNEYEYEYYLDMRKFYKMSVSFILAYAVMRYLDEVIKELAERKSSTDNYPFRNYILTKEIIDEVICWQIYWGIPQKPPGIIST